MILVKLLLCFIIFYLMPIFIGIQLIKKIENDKNDLILAYIFGNITVLSIFQIIAIPLIFLHSKFTTVLYLWLLIVVIFDIVCIIFNFNRFKEIVCSNFKKLKELPISSIIVVLLIGIQVFISFKYMYVNDDDARFVGMAVTSLETNTLLDIDATTGKPNTSIASQIRRALASYPIYTAAISKLTLFPPAIMLHTILPSILILFGYAVYYEVGKKVFKFEKNDLMLFLIILNIVNIFGNYSTRTNFTYFLLRIWQGKAIVAGIVVPLVWFLFFYIKENEKNLMSWILLVLLMFVAAMCSTIGIIIAPMSLMLLSFVFAIRDKSIKNLLKYLICSFPCIIYAGLYFFLLK